MMTENQMIKVILDYYSQSIDKNNPLRDTMFIDESMHGRMHNTLQSYDLMDN